MSDLIDELIDGLMKPVPTWSAIFCGVMMATVLMALAWGRQRRGDAWKEQLAATTYTHPSVGDAQLLLNGIIKTLAKFHREQPLRFLGATVRLANGSHQTYQPLTSFMLAVFTPAGEMVKFAIEIQKDPEFTMQYAVDFRTDKSIRRVHTVPPDYSQTHIDGIAFELDVLIGELIAQEDKD